jgi:hypothetical protein
MAKDIQLYIDRNVTTKRGGKELIMLLHRYFPKKVGFNLPIWDDKEECVKADK